MRNDLSTLHSTGPLRFDVEGEFLDNRISQHLARDTLRFGVSSVRLDVVFKSQEKVLALAYVRDARVRHTPKRIGYGFALSIEYRMLKVDIDMSLHRV